MGVSLRLEPAMPGTQRIPPIIHLRGFTVNVLNWSASHITVDLPKELSVNQLIQGLDVSLGLSAWPMISGEIKEVTGPSLLREDPTEEDLHYEMARLVETQHYELEQSEDDVELPVIEININTADVELLQPVGRHIWDSLFAKREPVYDLKAWITTAEADNYVYLPNDLSRGNHAEDYISNAYYTQVLVNAYTLLCKRFGLDPKIMLANKQVERCAYLHPLDGTQTTVKDGIADRLANSKLVNFDDSDYAREFLVCLCDLTPDQFHNEPTRRRVLSKAEFILMGRSSHGYNQKFVRALYDSLFNSGPDVPWETDRELVCTAALNCAHQMVIEGMIVEDKKDLFLSRMASYGYGHLLTALAKVFEDCIVKSAQPIAPMGKPDEE